MSGNLPGIGNNRIFNQQQGNRPGAAKTNTYTRALGSTNIHSSGWKPAARGGNPYDTQGMKANMFARARAGANVYAGRNSMSFGQLAQSSSGMDDMSKAMMYMQLGMMGVELGKGIGELFGAFKSDGSKTVKTPANDTVSGDPKTKIVTAKTVKSPSANSIAAMDGAKDSASLAAAISDAQLVASELETSIETITGQLTSLKDSYNEAQKAIPDLTKAVSTAKGAFKQAETSVKQKDQAVKSYEGKLNSAEQTLIESDAGYKAAAEAYNGARTDRQQQDGVVAQKSTNLATLQGQLAATPEKLPDGTSNPAHAALKQQVETAEGELRTAEQEQARLVEVESQKLEAKEQALNALDETKAGVKEAKDAVKKAQSDLTKADGELKAAKENFKEKEKALKEAEAKLEQQQKVVEDYESKEKDLEAKKEELKGLHKEIESQQNRLEKLKKSEEKDAKRLAELQEKQGKDNGWSRMVGKLTNREGRIENLQAKVAGTAGLNISSSTLDTLNDAGVMLDDDDPTVLLGQTFQASSDGTFKINGSPVSGKIDGDKTISAEENFRNQLAEANAQISNVRTAYYNDAVSTIKVTINGKEQTFEKSMVGFGDGSKHCVGVIVDGKEMKLSDFIKHINKVNS